VESPEERHARMVTEAMREADNLSIDDETSRLPPIGERSFTSSCRPMTLQVPGVKESSEHPLGFSWTQTEAELEVTWSTTETNCKVLFEKSKVQVLSGKELCIDLVLFEEIDLDGCTYTWEDQRGTAEKKLVISMEKKEQALWPRIED